MSVPVSPPPPGRLVGLGLQLGTQRACTSPRPWEIVRSRENHCPNRTPSIRFGHHTTVCRDAAVGRPVVLPHQRRWRVRLLLLLLLLRRACACFLPALLVDLPGHIWHACDTHPAARPASPCHESDGSLLEPVAAGQRVAGPSPPPQCVTLTLLLPPCGCRAEDGEPSPLLPAWFELGLQVLQGLGLGFELGLRVL